MLPLKSGQIATNAILRQTKQKQDWVSFVSWVLPGYLDTSQVQCCHLENHLEGWSGGWYCNHLLWLKLKSTKELYATLQAATFIWLFSFAIQQVAIKPWSFLGFVRTLCGKPLHPPWQGLCCAVHSRLPTNSHFLHRHITQFSMYVPMVREIGISGRVSRSQRHSTSL